MCCTERKKLVQIILQRLSQMTGWDSHVYTNLSHIQVTFLTFVQVSANKDVSDVHKHLTANISDRLYFNFHPHIKEDQRRKRPINLTHFLSLFFLLLSSLLALSSLKNQVGCV